MKKLPLSQHNLVFPERLLPLHAMISGVGCQEEEVHYRWHGLERGKSKFVLFQWTISGRGELVYEGKKYEMRPGRAMLLRMPHDHCYRLPEDSPAWRFVYVCLHGEEVLRCWEEYLRRHGPVWELGQESQPVQTAFKIYHAACDGGLDRPFVVSALAYEMTMSLANEAFGAKPGKEDPFVSVRAYVKTHIREELNVSRLAAVARMSRYYFTRQFTAAEGSSPGRFLLLARVKAAVDLLAVPHLSIKEVSARSGFQNANYMSKVFKRTLGVSPKDFRRSGMYSTNSLLSANETVRQTAPKTGRTGCAMRPA